MLSAVIMEENESSAESGFDYIVTPLHHPATAVAVKGKLMPGVIFSYSRVSLFYFAYTLMGSGVVLTRIRIRTSRKKNWIRTSREENPDSNLEENRIQTPRQETPIRISR